MAAYPVQQAYQADRDWRWSDATEHLDAVYRALDATRPADGVKRHTGNHPVQWSPWHPCNNGEIPARALRPTATASLRSGAKVAVKASSYER